MRHYSNHKGGLKFQDVGMKLDEIIYKPNPNYLVKKIGTERKMAPFIENIYHSGLLEVLCNGGCITIHSHKNNRENGWAVSSGKVDIDENTGASFHISDDDTTIDKTRRAKIIADLYGYFSMFLSGNDAESLNAMREYRDWKRSPHTYKDRKEVEQEIEVNLKGECFVKHCTYCEEPGSSGFEKILNFFKRRADEHSKTV